MGEFVAIFIFVAAVVGVVSVGVVAGVVGTLLVVKRRRAAPVHQPRVHLPMQQPSSDPATGDARIWVNVNTPSVNCVNPPR